MAKTQYLDYAGLTSFFNKLKELFATKEEAANGGILIEFKEQSDGSASLIITTPGTGGNGSTT